MAVVPFGYTYRNGVVVIDEEAAERVRTLFSSFLSGLSYKLSARSAGIKVTSNQAKRMILNTSYRGDEGFEAIVSEEEFGRAAAEQKRRCQASKTTHPGKRVSPPVPVRTDFSLDVIEGGPENPYARAAYIYSLIQEVIVDDCYSK